MSIQHLAGETLSEAGLGWGSNAPCHPLFLSPIVPSAVDSSFRKTVSLTSARTHLLAPAAHLASDP